MYRGKLGVHSTLEELGGFPVCNRVSSSAGADDLAETLTRRFSKYARFVETSREKKREKERKKRRRGGEEGKEREKTQCSSFRAVPFQSREVKIP